MELFVSMLVASLLAQAPKDAAAELAKFESERARLTASTARWGPELLERADSLAKLARDSAKAGRETEARLWATRALAALPGIPPGLPKEVSLILGDGRPTHSDEAKSIAISGSGNLMASGARDGSVKVWALPGGRELATFRAHAGEVLALAFGPDESILFTGGIDKEAKVWAWAESKMAGSFIGHAEGVTSLAISRDGSRLATGSLDRKARVFEIPKRTLLLEIPGHSLPVNSLDFSPDGLSLATASGDQKLRLFDTTNGGQKFAVSHFQGNLYSVRFLDAKTIALAGSRPGGVKVVDAVSGAERTMLDCQADSVLGIATSHDGRMLASLSSDRVARIWELPAGKVVRSIVFEETGRAIAISGDGARLAVATSHGVLRTWDLGEGGQGSRLVAGPGSSSSGITWAGDNRIITAAADGSIRINAPLSGQASVVQAGKLPLGAIAASGDGNWIAAGGADRLVHLIKGQDLKLAASLEGHQATVVALAVSRDGKFLVSADAARNVILRRIGEPNPVATWREGPRTPCSVSFSPDGSRIALGLADGTILLRDGATGRLESSARGQGMAVLALAFSPLGDLLVGGCADGRALVWETSRLQSQPAVFSGNAAALGGTEWHPIQAVHFRPDGKLVATAGADRTIRLWDPSTRTEQRALFGHSDWITGVAFSPDGEKLASVGATGETRVWRLESSASDFKPQGHAREVRSIAFSPDGLWLISGGQDATVRIWDAKSGLHAAKFEVSSAAIQQVAWVDSNQWLAAGSDRQLRLCSRDNPTALRQFALNGQGMANALQAIGGSRRAMAWVGDGQVEFHDLDGAVPRETWTCFEPGSLVTALSIGPRGNQVAIGGRSGQARVWDTKKRERVWKDDLPAHGSSIIDIALPEPDTKRLATADTQAIKVWNTATREAFRQIPVAMGQTPRQLAISPRADRVAAACVDGRVRVWNCENGMLVTDAGFQDLLPYDKPFFQSMAFDPAGRRLAVAGPAGRIYIMTIP